MPLPSFARPLPLDAHLDAEALTTDLVDVGNGYESLVKLFDLPRGGPTRIVDGELQFATAAARYITKKPGTSAPPANTAGIKVGIDGSRLFGPPTPARLDALWVKEAVDNAGAQVMFSGWVI